MAAQHILFYQIVHQTHNTYGNSDAVVKFFDLHVPSGEWGSMSIIAFSTSVGYYGYNPTVVRAAAIVGNLATKSTKLIELPGTGDHRLSVKQFKDHVKWLRGLRGVEEIKISSAQAEEYIFGRPPKR